MQAHEDLLEQLLTHCEVRHHPARTVVVKPGDAADSLYYVVEGSLSVQLEDDSGQALVLGYLHQGDFLGELGVFLESPARSVLASTRTATVVAGIRYDALQALLLGELAPYRADYLQLFGEHLARRLMKAERKVEDLALLDVSGRIARILLDLAAEPDAHTHPEGVRIQVTRTEIARLAGCSREMAGRCLRTLEDRELITSQGRSIIVIGAGRTASPLESDRDPGTPF